MNKIFVSFFNNIKEILEASLAFSRIFITCAHIHMKN